MSGTLENWLRRNTDIISQEYDEQVTCIIQTERKDIPDVVRDYSRGTIQPEFIRTLMREKDIERGCNG